MSGGKLPAQAHRARFQRNVNVAPDLVYANGDLSSTSFLLAPKGSATSSSRGRGWDDGQMSSCRLQFRPVASLQPTLREPAKTHRAKRQCASEETP